MAILIVLLAAYLVAVTAWRVRVTAHRSTYWKICGYEMLICACALVAVLPLPGLLRVVGLILTLPALVLLGLILLHMWDVPDRPAEHIIVLGMALERGRPNRDLVGRVAAAAECAQKHPAAAMIVTGGNGENGRTEAEVMRDLLAERGVARERILLEDKSSDTPENFRNVGRMIDPAWPVILVTSGFHMFRAVGIARDNGFTDVHRLSAKCDPLFLPANISWEIVCLIDRLTHKLKAFT